MVPQPLTPLLEATIQSKLESIRPEPLHTPPHGPSHVNIQFLNEFLKIYTYTPLESPKDDQVFFLQGFNEVR